MLIGLNVGSFYNGLENNFLETLQNAIKDRNNNLKQKILIIVPSSFLREYIVQNSTKTIPIPFINIHFLTLEALAVEIYNTSNKEISMPLDDKIFYAKFLKEILSKTNAPITFKNIVNNTYLALSLYEVLNDLVDANISPSFFYEILDFLKQENIEQKSITEITIKNLKELATVYEIFINSLKLNKLLNKHLRFQEVVKLLEEQQHIPILENIHSVFFYGFYDATQTQFDIIEQITRKMHNFDKPVHFFIPIDFKGREIVPECKYAERFYNDVYSMLAKISRVHKLNILDLNYSRASSGVEYQLLNLDIKPLPVSKEKEIKIISCAGTYDQILFCAKKILEIIQENYKFSDIAIVARNIQKYTMYFDIIFREHKIPFTGIKVESAVTHPLSKFLTKIFECVKMSFPTAFICEILSSTFFNEKIDRTSIDTFKIVAEVLDIKNLSGWERLKKLKDEQSELIEELFSNEYRIENKKEVIKKSLEIVVFVERQLKNIFKTRCRIAEHIENLKIFVEKQLVLKDCEYEKLWTKILQALTPYTLLQSEYDFDEFVQIFNELLKNLYLDEKYISGVLITDVMRYRGLNKKVLFVLGLNKDEFPREIIEEPFISDKIREKISEISGSKLKSKKRISLKEWGYDEELILFFNTIKSAEDKLYLLYERADDKGRLCASSVYLEKIICILGDSIAFNFPKNPYEKYDETLQRNTDFTSYSQLPIRFSVNSTLLTPYEISFYNTNIDDTKFETLLKEKYSIITKPTAYIKRVAKFAELLNQTSKNYIVDGQLQDFKDEVLSMLSENKIISLSQNAISTYIQCKFKYFSHYLLKLPTYSKESKKTFNTLILGNMTDKFLKRYFEKKRIYEGIVDEKIFKEVSESIKKEFSYILPEGILENYVDIIEKGVRNYLSKKDDNPFENSRVWDVKIYNNEFLEHIPENLTSENGFKIKLIGIPDAVFSKGNKLRIIDFKFTTAKTFFYSESLLYKSGKIQFVIYPILLQDDRYDIDFKYENVYSYFLYKDLKNVKTILLEMYKRGNIPKELIGNIEVPQNLKDIFGRYCYTGQIERYKKTTLKEIQEQFLNLNFVIRKEPDLSNFPCSYCDYYFICRWSNIPTILKAKKTQDGNSEENYE